MRLINVFIILVVLMISTSVEAGRKKIQQRYLQQDAAAFQAATNGGDVVAAEAARDRVVATAIGLPGDAAAARTVQDANEKLADLRAITALREAEAARREAARRDAERDDARRIAGRATFGPERSSGARRSVAVAKRIETVSGGGGFRGALGRAKGRIAARNDVLDDMRRRFTDQLAPAGCLGGQCNLGIAPSSVTPEDFARLDKRDGNLYDNRNMIFRSGMARFIAKGTMGSNLSAAQGEAGAYNSKDLLTNIQYAVRNFGKRGVGDAVIVPKALLTPVYLSEVNSREYGALLPAHGRP